MRCLACGRLSLSRLCRACLHTHLSPGLHTRTILGRIPVYSFYRYDEIESLLLSKHTDLGHSLFALLAKTAFKPFARAFDGDLTAAAVPVDDHAGHGYSHTAVLARALASKSFTPRYGRLRARSDVTYSGQSHQFRLEHPRRFRFSGVRETSVVLVDDIITTGSTLTQAVEAVHSAGFDVPFCLTLASVEA